jgi:hypothetical protein
MILSIKPKQLETDLLVLIGSLAESDAEILAGVNHVRNGMHVVLDSWTEGFDPEIVKLAKQLLFCDLGIYLSGEVSET